MTAPTRSRAALGTVVVLVLAGLVVAAVGKFPINRAPDSRYRQNVKPAASSTLKINDASPTPSNGGVIQYIAGWTNRPPLITYWVRGEARQVPVTGALEAGGGDKAPPQQWMSDPIVGVPGETYWITVDVRSVNVNAGRTYCQIRYRGSVVTPVTARYTDSDPGPIRCQYTIPLEVK